MTLLHIHGFSLANSPEHSRLWRPRGHALQRDGLTGGKPGTSPGPHGNDGSLGDGDPRMRRDAPHGVGGLAGVHARVRRMGVGEAEADAADQLPLGQVKVLKQIS